ncbi:hypothetical protein CHGG_05334 [Chaetomium globosum CBS 148.51]|uniref:Chromo domain-containing protein n=1 Tax=Chaetomium globosum (strain ATCC 6205 / CBS 148.51 / DSM 1962 / NBRC 6347 / NRRL 1970) TaxID=306901 RepID=Q2H7N1_CHAGB|nr:uncharacterized protein CHGG_05334 [Chaetomium globosum CBS 148.51]EAQ88715.1 hypothetical protein CHGG_05334 [Chaetomium globosum CBS 148.51]
MANPAPEGLPMLPHQYLALPHQTTSGSTIAPCLNSPSQSSLQYADQPPSEETTQPPSRDSSVPESDGGSHSKLWHVCYNVGLSGLFLVGKLFKGDTDGRELKKVVMHKRRRMVLLRSVIHIIPAAAAVLLLAFNGASYYIGGELAGWEDQDDQKLAALQFAAKVHELWMLFSLTSILVTYIRKELVFGDGVPFAALLSLSQFHDLAYLWSRDLWGILTHKWQSKKKMASLVSLIVLCTLLGFTVGPSSAILMQPRLREWPAGGTSFWIDRSLGELYPTIMNASASISHCLLYFSYWGQITPMGTMPDFVQVSSRYSQRVLNSKVRAPANDDNELLYVDAYTLSSVALAPVADAAAELLRLWKRAVQKQNSRLRYNLDEIFNIFTKQPIVFARCESNPPTASGVQLPVLSSIPRVVGLVEHAMETQSLSYDNDFANFAALRDELEPALDPSAGAGSLPSVFWVGDPALLERVNASISAVVAIPRYGDSPGPAARLYGCSITAVLGDTATETRTNKLKIVDGWPQNYTNSGVFKEAYQPVGIDPAWARYLNPSDPFTNSSALAQILASAGMWNGSWPAMPGYDEIILENILTTLIANGIARANYHAGVRWDLLKDPVNPASLWSGGGWTSEMLPRGGGVGKGGQAFHDPTDTTGNARFTLEVRAKGYAYSASGKTQLAAMVVLGTYVAVVVAHVAISLKTKWSSAVWGSPPEVAALALNSTPPAVFRNTGAGVWNVDVHRQTVRVRAVDGRLELVFDGVDERHGTVPLPDTKRIATARCHASQPTEDYEIAALQQQSEDPEARPLQPFVECCAVFREQRLERGFQGTIADYERDAWQEEPESKIAGLRLEGTRLWYHDKAYVRPSDQKELIRKIHESKLGGHMGIGKTIAKVKQNYDFPGIKQATEEVLADRRTTMELGDDGFHHQASNIEGLSDGNEADLRQGPDVSVPRAAVKADRMSPLHAMLKEELEFLRTRMKKFYDRNRLEGPRLEEGGRVYLISRNLFKVDKRISENNCALALPSTMRLRTNVFHVSLLEPAPKNARLDKGVEAEDEEEFWDVEEILDSRITRGRIEYLVKWQGFGPEDNSWQPATNFNCPEELENFHRRNPDRPKEAPRIDQPRRGRGRPKKN